MRTFYGKVNNGKVQLYEKEEFKNLVQKLEGKQVELLLEKYKAIRSVSQNRYYWGVVLEHLSDTTGYTPDELHETMKEMFLGKKRISIADKVVNISKSSKELSVDEFIEFTDKVRDFAQKELNCFIPLPNEYEQFINEKYEPEQFK